MSENSSKKPDQPNTPGTPTEPLSPPEPNFPPTGPPFQPDSPSIPGPPTQPDGPSTPGPPTGPDTPSTSGGPWNTTDTISPAPPGSPIPPIRAASATESSPQPPLGQQQQKRGVAPLIAVFLAGVLVTVGGFAIGKSLSSGPNREAAMRALEEAVVTCDLEGDLNPYDMHVSFRTFTNRTVEDVGSGLTFGDVQCIFGELDMPLRISSLIRQSSTIDGHMKEQWGPYQIQWTHQELGGIQATILVLE